MTALTPAVTAAGSYFVQVEVFNVYSTQTSATFTYSVQVPLIVSLNPLNGTTGNQLTITGANFLTGSTVAFCPTAKYNFTNFSCTVTATAATVSGTPATTATQMSSASRQWRRATTTPLSRCLPARTTRFPRLSRTTSLLISSPTPSLGGEGSVSSSAASIYPFGD